MLSRHTMYVAHRPQGRSLYAVMLSRHTMYVAHRPQHRSLYAVMLSRHAMYVAHRPQRRTHYVTELSKQFVMLCTIVLRFLSCIVLYCRVRCFQGYNRTGRKFDKTYETYHLINCFVPASQANSERVSINVVIYYYQSLKECGLS